MFLSRPKFLIFLISLVLAVMAVITHYGFFTVPVVAGNTFLILLLAYVILLAGNLFRKL